MIMIRLIFFVMLIFVVGCDKVEKIVSLPLPPSNLEAQLVDGSQVDLTWKDNATNETGYKIERKETGLQFTTIANLNSDVTFYSDKGINLGVTYTYRVLCFNKDGNSLTYSNEVTIITQSVPILSTINISDLTRTSARSGGNIINNGGIPITSKGVCWDTKPNPTISSKKNIITSGDNLFISLVADLLPGTLYYLRAFATNSLGTGYGNEISFSTLSPTLPILITLPANPVGSSTAMSGVTLSDNGGSTIFETGICWSEGHNPTISLTNFSALPFSGNIEIGTYSLYIKGLYPNKTYFVRSYAKTNLGIVYGNEISFRTASAPDLSYGLLSYYPFNGNANDLSGKNNHGTVIGATLVPDRFGKLNSAYSFNGVSDYIMIKNSPSLTPSTNQMTVAVWVKIKQFTGSPNKAACIIEKNNDDFASYGEWGILYQDFDKNFSIEKLRFGNYFSYENYPLSGTVLFGGYYTDYLPSINKWIHLVFIVDGKTGTNLYINGDNVYGGVGGGEFQILPNNANIYIGRSGTIKGTFFQIEGSNYNYFNGIIDDIRIYNRILTDDEIQYIFLH